MKRSPLEGLTDEQVLKEFVKRFKPDAAMLIYFDQDNTFGFTRWRNKKGKEWEKLVAEGLAMRGINRISKTKPARTGNT